MSAQSSKKRSAVWNYFCKADNRNYVACNICTKSIKSCGGTSNLMQHLLRVHRINLQNKPKLSDEPDEYKNQNIKKEPYATSCDNDPLSEVIIIPKIDPDLLNMKPKDYQVEAAVENDGFLEFSLELPNFRMKPFKKRSVVWKYFRAVDKKNLATCNICEKGIKYFGGTTNMMQHLLRIHPTLNLEKTPENPDEPDDEHEKHNMEKDSSTISSSNAPHLENIAIPTVLSHKSELQKKQLANFSAGSTSELSESRISKIDSKLLKIITKDYQPVSLVENEGFLEYSYELQPLYKPPSSKQLTCDILPKHYNEAASSLKLILKEVKHCAITTDIWTSDNNRSYLTVTSHFIYEDKIHARVLATEEILEAHPSENIAGHLAQISNDWDIGDKIVTVVTDNGDNVKKAVINCLQLHHYPCVAHTLNSSVTDALSSIQELGVILKKCRALVGHIKNSVNASEKLKCMQELMDLPILKVKQDVATRWNSTFIMLTRLVQIKDPLRVAVINLPETPEFLDADEWKIIEECIEVLKPANNLTAILSAEAYPAISLMIPLIRGYQFTLKNVNTETDVGEQLKETLIETSTRRLDALETNNILAKACFLDPRFKKFGFGSEDNANNAQKWVTEELAQLIAAKTSEPMQIDSQQPQSCSSNDDIWSLFDNNLSKTTTLSNPSALIVGQYLEMPPLERQKDPLEFWAIHKLIFPEMHELAMKYLCVPATSVPSERVFSKTGLLTNYRRSRLAPKNLNHIVFLNSRC